MANNYSQFSEIIPNLSPEAVAWANEVMRLDADAPEDAERLFELLSLEGEHDLSCWPDFGWRWGAGGELLLYSEEYFDSAQLELFVRELICRFMPDYTFAMTAAEYCSKLRPGEFGGSWMVISKDRVEGGSTWDEVYKYTTAAAASEREKKSQIDR